MNRKRLIHKCPICSHVFKNFVWRKVLFSLDIDQAACCPKCKTPAYKWKEAEQALKGGD